MTMDGLEALPPPPPPPLYPPHGSAAAAFFLTEGAGAATPHFNLLSFDTCLLKGPGPGPGPAHACYDSHPVGLGGPAGSPLAGQAAGGAEFGDEAAGPDAEPGDLNTPVTTSSDLPSFFPSTVVEPPPISGESTCRS